MDAESEMIVQDALDSVTKGRTTIIVAHRLSTLRNADIVAVINKANISEVGTHEYLMAKKGDYFKLVEHQTS